MLAAKGRQGIPLPPERLSRLATQNYSLFTLDTGWYTRAADPDCTVFNGLWWVHDEWHRRGNFRRLARGFTRHDPHSDRTATMLRMMLLNERD